MLAPAEMVCKFVSVASRWSTPSGWSFRLGGVGVSLSSAVQRIVSYLRTLPDTRLMVEGL